MTDDHEHTARYGTGATWIEAKTNSAGTIECTLPGFGRDVKDPLFRFVSSNQSQTCQCLPPPDYGKPEGLFDITYLLLENRCSEPGPRPYKRARFFDLGCTYFAEPAGKTYDVLDPDRISQGSGYGPSISLFYNLYHQHCVDFDDIYAFEGRPLNAADWWSTVPSFLRHRIRFYNTYVEELLGKKCVNQALCDGFKTDACEQFVMRTLCPKLCSAECVGAVAVTTVTATTAKRDPLGRICHVARKVCAVRCLRAARMHRMLSAMRVSPTRPIMRLVMTVPWSISL